MQKDLFGAAAINAIPSQSYESKPDFLQRYRINLRLDQTIIAALLLVIAYIFVFSFGVESGKRYAMDEIKAERSMRERMARELGEKIFSNNQQLAGLPESSKTNLAPASATIKTLSASAVINETAPASVTTASKNTAAAAAPSTSKEKGKFAVQTVTFTSKATAEKYLKSLLGKGYQGSILVRGKFQQVCVTGFETKAQAADAMTKLKALGLAPKDAYIRTLS